MTPAIPKGTPIGRIETSLDWLLSHTTRLQGAILIRVSEGKGLILIEYGRPVAFLFRLGNRVVLGEAARRLFARYEFLHASLHRYTDQEFRTALSLVGPGAWITDYLHDAGEIPPFMNIPREQGMRQEPENRSPGSFSVNTEPVFHQSDSGTTNTGISVYSYGREQEQASGDVLDRIADIPGVDAAAIFREGSIVDSRGYEYLENVIEPAEEVLLSVFEVLALLSTGPLVQITVRLSGRNVTIAPFDHGYLLVLTNPGINLGHIRKLVYSVHRETGCEMG